MANRSLARLHDLVGVPFRIGGRDADGCDCWGLVRLAYARFGVDLPAYQTGYASLADHQRVAGWVAAGCADAVWRLVGEPAFGDVVLFEICGFATHVGFVIDRRSFLHIAENELSSIERLDGLQWSRRKKWFYRHADFTIQA